MNFLTTRTGKGGSPQVLIKATAFYLSPAKALAANASVQANLDTVAKARAALSLNVFRPVVTGFNNTEVSLPPARVSLSERYVGDSYLWVWSDGLMAVLWSVLGAAILSCVATCGAHAPCACTVRMHRPSPPWAPPLAAMGTAPRRHGECAAAPRVVESAPPQLPHTILWLRWDGVLHPLPTRLSLPPPCHLRDPLPLRACASPPPRPQRPLGKSPSDADRSSMRRTSAASPLAAAPCTRSDSTAASSSSPRRWSPTLCPTSMTTSPS